MKLPTRDVVDRALSLDPVARRIMAKGLRPSVGELVGVRLNLNLLRTQGVEVHSVHRGNSTGGHKMGRGFYRGTVLTYMPVVVLSHAYFNVDQKARDLIASGSISKCPMASVDGEMSEVAESIPLIGEPISFNPKRVHLFVDGFGHAVQYAERVIIVGHRVYASGNLRYFRECDAPRKVGSAPSCVQFRS